jgi:branched-chain amino acid transport system permease protein
VDILVVQLLNGLVAGMLLFIMAAGLSLIFGQLNIVNLSHGALYLLGGYLGLTIARQTNAFWPALILAPPLVAVVGWLIVRLLLWRQESAIAAGRRHLEQVLLTFGAALVLSDLIQWNWGATVASVPPPAFLAGQAPVFGLRFPVYRLALLAAGLVLALMMWLIFERTRLGMILRAGVADSQMVSGLGINVQRVFTLVFAAGAGLAALAGVLGAPVTTLYPGLDLEILMLTIVVVIVGGLGSLRGAFLGALLIGMADTIGKALFPEFALFFIFSLMALVLVVRPHGLFGEEQP